MGSPPVAANNRQLVDFVIGACNRGRIRSVSASKQLTTSSSTITPDSSVSKLVANATNAREQANESLATFELISAHAAPPELSKGRRGYTDAKAAGPPGPRSHPTTSVSPRLISVHSLVDDATRGGGCRLQEERSGGCCWRSSKTETDSERQSKECPQNLREELRTSQSTLVEHLPVSGCEDRDADRVITTAAALVDVRGVAAASDVGDHGITPFDALHLVESDGGPSVSSDATSEGFTPRSDPQSVTDE